MAWKIKVVDRDEEGMYKFAFAGIGLKYADDAEVEIQAAEETHTLEELLGEQELLNAKLKAIDDYDKTNPA